ncbi:hypothetical protein FisN_3Hu001, partial [Fistulifera solaris]
VTISRTIGWRTIAPVPNCQKATMLKELRRLLEIYKGRGLPVTAIHGDNDFACLRDDLGPVRLDIVAPNTHVPEIERSNRTIKERARTTIHGLPYTRLPVVFIQHLMMNVVHLLNIFPWKYGVSDDLSPETIMTGSPPPDYNTMRIEFGAYAQVYDSPTPSNTPRSRTHGAIALGPTGNHGGAYYFLSLASGEVIVRHQWTICPIRDPVIAQMAALGERDNQPLIQTTGLIVEWGDPDQIYDSFPDEIDDPFPIHDLDQGAENLFFADEENQDNQDNHNQENQDENEYENGDETQDHNQMHEAVHNHDHESETEEAMFDEEAVETLEADINEQIDAPQGAQEEAFLDQVNINQEALEAQGAPEFENNEDQTHQEVEHLVGAEEGAAFDNEEQRETDNNPAPQIQEARYNLRNRENLRAPTRLAESMDEPHSSKAYETPTVLFQTILVQAALNTIDQEGQKGKMNMKQLQKIIFGRVFAQLTAKAAIKLYGEDAVQALMKEFAQLDDLEVFMAMRAENLTRAQKKSALRAINLVTKKRDGRIKGRTVADGSVQKDMYDKSQTASPTVSTDALLLSLIVDAHEGRDVAIADVVGAYLKANMKDFTLLKFTGESVDIMCKMNPKYEAFVAVEGGKRVLYVQLLKALYGCVCSALLWYEMFAGALQDMGFELNPYDTCIANKMINGKQCTIAWYVDDMKVSHVDPAVVTSVIEEIESRFGKMSVTRGSRHKFLVTKSTQQDRAKLKRVLEYVKGTLDLTYTMGADSLNKMQSWVDAAFAVHPDMKSHTGGITSFGRGGLVCKSAKQKLNTRSSTEAELVGASDYLPHTIWVKLFMEAQGHKMTEIVFEQDNESAIRMETNGRLSAGQKSRHIDIRYFWIKDRTTDMEIRVRHCPTLVMLADFFTKPLNGGLFRKFRDVILGYKHVDSLREIPPTEVEERVGMSNDIGRLPSDRNPASRDVIRITNVPRIGEPEAKGQDPSKRVKGNSKQVSSRPATSVTWADLVAGKAQRVNSADVDAGREDRILSDESSAGHLGRSSGWESSTRQFSRCGCWSGRPHSFG